MIDLTAELAGNYKQRSLERVRYIVVHHTAAVFDNTPEEIDAYHKSLGWPGIGYHYVVRQDGTVYQVGPLDTTRYNVGGQNPYVVGIVLCGDFTEAAPQILQLQGLMLAIADCRNKLPVWNTPVVGHRDIAATACPGDTWDEWRRLVS